MEACTWDNISTFIIDEQKLYRLAFIYLFFLNQNEGKKIEFLSKEKVKQDHYFFSVNLMSVTAGSFDIINNISK